MESSRNKLWSLLMALAAITSGVVQGQGVGGYALRVNGTTGYAEVASSTDLNSFPLTISVWIRTSDRTTVNAQGIVSKYADASYNGWSLFLSQGKLKAWYFRSGQDSLWSGLETAEIADGKWHHVAFVAAPWGGRIYVDGVVQATGTWIGSPGPCTTTEPVRIARYHDYAVRFPGDLDEITLWNEALSAEAVNYIKHRKLSGSEDGLIALWHLDENGGATLADATSKGHTATVVEPMQWRESDVPMPLRTIAGRALQFDGVDDQVNCGHRAELNTLPLTIMAWIKTTQRGTASFLTKYSGMPSKGYALGLNEGRLQAWYYVDDNNYILPGFAGPQDRFIADGQWHHVAFVADTSGGRTYINGKIVHTQTWQGTAAPASTDEPLRLGVFNSGGLSLFFAGQLDRISIWNRVLNEADLLNYAHLPFSAEEAGLLVAYEMNETEGTSLTDLKGVQNGTLENNPSRVGSLARMGDGSQHWFSTLESIELTRPWAVRTIDEQEGFPMEVAASFRSIYDYGNPPPPRAMQVTLSGELETAEGTDITLSPPALSENRTITLSSYNASAPPSAEGYQTVKASWKAQPEQGLDSVNQLYAAKATLNAQAEGGEAVNQSLATLPIRLLDFSGILRFGPVVASFEALANTPVASAISAPEYLVTQLTLPGGAGQITGQPAVTFGGGSLEARLLPNGDALVVQGNFDLVQAANTLLERAGVRYRLVAPKLSPDGATAPTILIFLPVGFGFQTHPEIRALIPLIAVNDVALDGSLVPASDVTLTAAFLNVQQLYFSEETKPFWIVGDQITWRVQAGEFLIPSASAVNFVRQQEDDLLRNATASLVDPSAAKRVSNDSFYLNMTAAPNTPVVIKPGPQGTARLFMRAELKEAEVRSHFPYISRQDDQHIPSIGGTLVIADDLIDTKESRLQVANRPWVISYARDCEGQDCGNMTTGPAALQFTPDIAELRFTPDGGLYGKGEVPSQNLTWGYQSGENYAHRTSDVETGIFFMAGTFLRGDQSPLASSQLSGVLLLSGHSLADDAVTTERPGTEEYAKGLTDYPGINFRTPAQGMSRIAAVDAEWHNLTPRSKYYARWSGISGIHEYLQFNKPLMLYGYPFSFRNLGISFLDSANFESRTEGSIDLPFPAGFKLDFNQLTLLCRGGLKEARLPSENGEKMLAYWRVAIVPKTLVFERKPGEACNPSQGNLVLGVEAKLPLITEPVHGLLGIRPDGSLRTLADALADGTKVDSRFYLPDTLHLAGPHRSRYKLHVTEKGYLNDPKAPNAPESGFFNIIGLLDLPFFNDAKTHLHVRPSGNETFSMMGGWPAANFMGKDYGWSVQQRNFFNSAGFDAAHRGFPEELGNVDLYRKNNSELFHPRAQHEWLDVVTFDFPLLWNPVSRRLNSFQDSPVSFPVVTVGGKIKELTPSRAHLEFAQDIDLELPVIKAIDLLAEAEEAYNAPFNTLSNVFREVLRDAFNETGLTKGLKGLRQTLNDNLNEFLDPIFREIFNPVIDALIDEIAQLYAQHGQGFIEKIPGLIQDAQSGVAQGMRRVNGATNQPMSVLGQLNTVLMDIDNTLGLLVRLLEKEEPTRQRRMVRILIQKLVADQGPLLNLGSSLGDDILNSVMAELDPTLEDIHDQLKELQTEFQKVRTALGDATGLLQQSLSAINSNSGLLSDVLKQVSNQVTQWMKGQGVMSGNFFEEKKDELKSALRQSIIQGFLASGMSAQYQQVFKQFLADDEALLNMLMDSLFQEINRGIREGLSSKLQNARDNLVQGFKGPQNLTTSLGAARIRGQADINGQALNKVRLDALVQMKVPDSFEFNGFIEVRAVNSATTPISCIPAGGSSAEIVLGAIDAPLNWAGLGGDHTVDVEARWNLNQGDVYGIGGLLRVKGSTQFKSVSVNEFGAAMAFGAEENYFAARADGTVNGITGRVGIFAGRSCRLDPLQLADPQVAEVLQVPGAFTGVYLYYGGDIDVTELFGLDLGCVLEVKGFAHNSFYYLNGTGSGMFGGRMRIGAEGTLLCILHGKLEWGPFLTVQGNELFFGGTAKATGRIGVCPFCKEGSVSLTIKAVVNEGGIDYHVDY